MIYSRQTVPRPTHSDLHRARVGGSDQKSLRNERMEAIALMSEQFGVGPKAVELGTNIVTLTRADRASRKSHHEHLRRALGREDYDPVLANGEDIGRAARTLAIFDEYLRDPSIDIDTSLLGSFKGLSAELGHVEQYGVWDAAGDLDQAVRHISQSALLLTYGFTIENDYSDIEDAKLSYRFKMMNGEQDANRVSIMAVRKRAVADVVGPRGHLHQVIARSSFLLDTPALSPDQFDMIGGVIVDPRDADLMSRAGMEIVEPHVADKSLRGTKVLPVSRLYFDLHRNDDDSSQLD